MKTTSQEIEIITHREVTPVELTNIGKIAKECGLEEAEVSPKIVRKMAAELPPELLILVWVGGPIVVGFLREIGKDLWRNLKKFILGAFKYFENEQQPDYNLNIRLEVRVNAETKIQLWFPKKDLKELKEALEELDPYLKDCKPDQFLALYFYKGQWISQEEYSKKLKSKRNRQPVSEG